MRNILSLTLILIIFNSCTSNKKESNPLAFNNKPNIDRSLQISQIFYYQYGEDEKYNKKLYDTLNTLIKDPQILKEIALVRSETEKVTDSLYTYHNLIVMKTGGYTVKTHYKGGLDTIFIDSVFIKPNGPADKIKLMLNKYSALMDSLGRKTHTSLGDINPVFKYHPDFKHKGFTYTYFKGSNVIEAITVLVYLRGEVLNIEERYYTDILIKNNVM